MRREEFTNEVGRLFAGTGAGKYVTPERMNALWDAFGHEPLVRFRAAVSALIADGQRVTRSSIHSALAEVEEIEQRTKVSTQRGGTISESFGRAIYAAPSESFRSAIYRTMFAASSGESPATCADLLEQDALFDPETDFSAWIEAMRSSPDDWQGVPTRAADGGSLVGTVRR